MTSFLDKIKEKLKGNNWRAKSSRHFFTLFGTFPHIFTLLQSFSEFFLQDFFFELRGLSTVSVQRDEKRIKDNKKKKTKPFCTLVVARLSSANKNKHNPSYRRSFRPWTFQGLHRCANYFLERPSWKHCLYVSYPNEKIQPRLKLSLCLLSRRILWIFFLVFAWEFCIEKWRGFLLNCFWSPSPTKRNTKNPRKIREKFGAKFGAKFGTKIRKIRGTFVLQLFWPKKLSISLDDSISLDMFKLDLQNYPPPPHTHTHTK